MHGVVLSSLAKSSTKQIDTFQCEQNPHFSVDAAPFVLDAEDVISNRYIGSSAGTEHSTDKSDFGFELFEQEEEEEVSAL